MSKYLYMGDTCIKKEADYSQNCPVCRCTVDEGTECAWFPDLGEVAHWSCIEDEVVAAR